MGKAIPRGMKRRAEEIMEEFPEKVSKDFDKNKALVDSLEMPFTKESRNLMAGFITRTMSSKA